MILGLTITSNLHARPGDLNPSFNGTGKVITPVSLLLDSICSLAIQSDQKIIAAGYSGTSIPIYPDTPVSLGAGGGGTIIDDRIETNFRHWTLARYNIDGTLDTDFGASLGFQSTFFNFSFRILSNADEGAELCGNYFPMKVVIQEDNKIVVAGPAAPPSYYQLANRGFGLARYTRDGDPDLSFGDGGTVFTPFDEFYPIPTDVKVLPDGKIMVAGVPLYPSEQRRVAISKYTSFGHLDPSFGSGGKLILPLESAERVRWVLIQSNGQILAGGYYFNSNSREDSSIMVIRFNANGTRDSRFGENGRARFASTTSFDYEVVRIAVQSWDNKIIWVGNKDFSAHVARFNDNGTIDTTFGSGGIVQLPLPMTLYNSDIIYSVTPINRSIILAGLSAGRLGFRLARLDSFGVLDDTFGARGIVTTHFSEFHDIAFAMTIQSVRGGDSLTHRVPDICRIIVGGIADNDPGSYLHRGDFALSAYESNHCNNNETTPPIITTTTLPPVIPDCPEGSILLDGQYCGPRELLVPPSPIVIPPVVEEEVPWYMFWK